MIIRCCIYDLLVLEAPPPLVRTLPEEEPPPIFLILPEEEPLDLTLLEELLLRVVVLELTLSNSPVVEELFHLRSDLPVVLLFTLP